LLRERGRLTFFLSVVVAAGAVVASACSSTTTASSDSGPTTPGTAAVQGPSTVIPADEGTPQTGGALVYGVDGEPAGLSPVANNFDTSAQLIASSMLESLTVFDKDAHWQPYLAESLTPSNLASKWTIKLKPNITFTDGTPLDAAAVKANLDAYRAGLASIAMKVITDIVVVDPLTVDVDMNQPWASFPGFLAGQQGLMQSVPAITANDAGEHPVGTGPFELVSWNHGSSIVTKKNVHYWQPGKPYLDKLEFRIIVDPTTRANALESGDVNMIFTDQPQTMVDFKTKQGFKEILDASGDVQSIVMNQAAPPFDNVNARKALVLATDSKAVTQGYGAGVLVATDQPFSEKNPYHQSDPHYPGFDLDAAKKAVDEYTKETGKPLEFTLTTFNGSGNVALSQLLQDQWAKAGIKAQIDPLEQAAAIKEIIVGKTEATLTPNFGYPDPDWYYNFWHSDFTAPIGQLSINFPHLKNKELDDALVEGRVNLVPSMRKEAYNKAVQIINDNYSYVWIYRYVAALIADGSVHGLKQAEDVGFASIATKPWYQDLWVSAK
jgi:ABC-type transport system substrate-binding protein